MLKKHPAISILGSMAIALFLEVEFHTYGAVLGAVLVGFVMLGIAMNNIEMR